MKGVRPILKRILLKHNLTLPKQTPIHTAPVQDNSFKAGCIYLTITHRDRKLHQRRANIKKTVEPPPLIKHLLWHPIFFTTTPDSQPQLEGSLISLPS